MLLYQELNFLACSLHNQKINNEIQSKWTQPTLMPDMLLIALAIINTHFEMSQVKTSMER